MTKTYLHHYSVTIFSRMKCEHKNVQNNIHFIILIIIDINAGCPLNSNQKNDKKMTILFVKNERKKKKMKMSKKKAKKNTMKAKLKIN